MRSLRLNPNDASKRLNPNEGCDLLKHRVSSIAEMMSLALIPMDRSPVASLLLMSFKTHIDGPRFLRGGQAASVRCKSSPSLSNSSTRFVQALQPLALWVYPTKVALVKIKKKAVWYLQGLRVQQRLLPFVLRDPRKRLQICKKKILYLPTT